MTSSHEMGGATEATSVRWRLYRIAWSLCFGSLILVGISVSATALSPATLAGLVLAISLPAAASVAAWSMVSMVPRYVAVMTGVWAPVLLLTAYGLALAFGPWSLLWLLALVIGSPTALRLARVLTRTARRSPAVSGDARNPRDLSFDDPHAPRLLDPECPEARRPVLSTLSFGDLGDLWRMSGSWLADGLGTEETAHLVRLRESCLDEMERRDPQGFWTWFPLAHPADAKDFEATARNDPPSRGEGAT